MEPRTTTTGRRLTAGSAFLLGLALLAFSWATAASTAAAAGPAGSRGDAGSSIVGGRDTTASKFPWQVLITANDDEFCGGTLIHPMIILTAAHCLLDEEGNYYEDDPGLDFRAYTGRTRVDVGGEELQWRTATVDSRYDPSTSRFDWGFIILWNPASARTLKLAGPDELPLWRAGKKATVSGFGNLYEDGPSALILQQVTVPVLPDSGCSSYGTDFDGETQLCAGYLDGGRDACQGDSGGPLVATGDRGARRLIGVVSTGNGCALEDFPGIYTRVADPDLALDIQAEVSTIETVYAFPADYTGLNVIGAGARPFGCAASISARKRAEQRVMSRKRDLKSAKRKGSRSRIYSAKRRLENAKTRLGKSRANSKRICF